jgi:hypothetical protein
MFTDDSSNSKISKIYTPYNVKYSITLPVENNTDVWYMVSGTIITELPQNLDHSVVIEKNKIPEGTPETPSEPETPETPSEPETPETPSEPETPSTPETENNEGFKAAFAEDVSDLTYTGSAITPKVTATFNGKTLTEGTDYTVKYTDNVNYSDNNAKVTVTGKGNYTGNTELKFSIVRNNIGEVKASKSIVVVSGQKPKLTISFNGKNLGTKDYSIKYLDASGKEISNGKYTGNGLVELTGKGNFTGTRTITVTVAQKQELKKLSASLNINSKTYTGSPLTLSETEYTVTTANTTDKLAESADDGATGDYIVTYANNTKAGTAKVTFTGIGYYTGSSVTKTFKITPVTTGVTHDKTKIKSGYPYNASGVTIGSDLVFTYNGVRLTENTDYRVKYTNNKKPGNTASYKVTFTGNYKGSEAVSGSFSIDTPDLGDNTAVKAVSADKIYKKAGVYTSAPTVTYNGTTVKPSEYTVKYYSDANRTSEITKANPLNLADAEYATVYVRITGKGKTYKGTCDTCEFNVWKSTGQTTDLSKATVTITGASKNKMQYTGKELAPTVEVKIKSGKTTVTVDPANYTVIYYNNVNLGKATVMIKAKEKSGFIGSKKASFTITKSEINKK